MDRSAAWVDYFSAKKTKPYQEVITVTLLTSPPRKLKPGCLQEYNKHTGTVTLVRPNSRQQKIIFYVGDVLTVTESESY